MCKSCKNCARRYYESIIGVIMCEGWERADFEDPEHGAEEMAESCSSYINGDANVTRDW